jgi:mRNA interferase RelE/StbE
VNWKVNFSSAAARDYKNLDRQIRDRINAKLDAVAKLPLSPEHSKALIGLGELRSARVGNWRILFLARDGVVNIVRIRHRREVYKDL